jgi:hypothetical protein
MFNRNFFAVMPAFVLVLGLVLAGCPNETTGGDESFQRVSNLPPFEGEFVASEQEATTLALNANIQIQQAIETALSQGAQANESGARAVVSRNGHYEYNGISLDYTVTGNMSSDTFPFYYDAKELVSVDGTYNGYKIKGNYNVNLHFNYASQTEYSIRYDYDCWYTVSRGGKGMKVVTTGEMNMTSPGTYTYNLHYTVYDNNNVSRYNYDYSGSN